MVFYNYITNLGYFIVIVFAIWNKAKTISTQTNTCMNNTVSTNLCFRINGTRREDGGILFNNCIVANCCVGINFYTFANLYIFSNRNKVAYINRFANRCAF